jgi:hypothetical protein
MACGKASQLLLPALAFIHGYGLQLIHDPRAHLHQPVAKPEQSPPITILRTRYPDLRKAIFEQ